jgi:hypothetical protein
MSKKGNLDIDLFSRLKEQENSKYSVRNTLTLKDSKCKTINIKKDQSKIVICREDQYDDTGKLVSVYSKLITYTSEYDGFKCELNELSYYNTSGQITHSQKYLSGLIHSHNTKLYLPLENITYQNGNVSEIKRNEFLIPLHKILTSIFSIYQRQKLGQQGGETVGLENYEYSRSEVLKMLNEVKDKFEITKDIEDEYWVITFSKKQSDYILNFNDKSGEGKVQLDSKRSVEEDILH